MFITLVSQSSASLSREELDELFGAVRPEALDATLKRFREVNLLAWDETQRRYSITPLSQKLYGALSSLNTNNDDDLANLLGQVVGADQLGTLDASQVQMLQAQLGRQHDDFSEAIASSSEFRLRDARKRYERAARLIDKASNTITSIISNAQGNIAMERAARALGQAQSKLLAMASQFNRALQQVDRQRVTLGTTGITSTDVKMWLQALATPELLMDGALFCGVNTPALAQHELLDVTEAEFEKDRPQSGIAETLPPSQKAPEGNLSVVALPQELYDLSNLLTQWSASVLGDSPSTMVHDIAAALLDSTNGTTRYAQVAYKAQLLPLLGDLQAQRMPGTTGDLARQPWLVELESEIRVIDHPAIEQLSGGRIVQTIKITQDTEVAKD